MQSTAHSIIGISKKRKKNVLDLEMKSKYHNFVANGIIVGNSHSLAYAMVSMRCLYLKTYYPIEYYSSVLSNMKTGDKRVPIYIQDGKYRKIKFKGIDINKSKFGFSIDEDDSIIVGFDKIKGISKDAQKLIELQPFSSFKDYLDRFGYAKKAGEALIKLGAFDNFSKNRNKLLKYWEYCREIKGINSGINSQKFGKAYKELTGSKSCPKDITEKFKEICNFDKKNTSISLEDIKQKIENGEFESILDSSKFLNYLQENRGEFENQIMSFEDFENHDDFTALEKGDIELEYCGFEFNDILEDYQKPPGTSIMDALEGNTNTIAVAVSGYEVRRTAKNLPYYILNVRDSTGKLNIVIWNDTFIQNSNLIISKKPLLIDVSRPEKEYWSWNFKKNGKMKRLRLKTEPTEEEESLIEGTNDFNILINSMKEN